MITQERLKEVLHYDPDTGVFTWAVKIRQLKPGDIAGCSSKGHLVIRVDGRLYQAHRLAWLYVHGRWPDKEIDHINHNGKDNRLENLREASRQENGRNISLPSNNTSGHIGVCWDKSRSKWTARIKVDQATVNLGRFDDFEDAVAARKAAETKYEFHRNHGHDISTLSAPRKEQAKHSR